MVSQVCSLARKTLSNRRNNKYLCSSHETASIPSINKRSLGLLFMSRNPYLLAQSVEKKEIPAKRQEETKARQEPKKEEPNNELTEIQQIQQEQLMEWSSEGEGEGTTRKESFVIFNPLYIIIGGLHCRHVGVQSKRKFVHIVCIKMEVNSQRRKILLFLNTNMAAMTSQSINNGTREQIYQLPTPETVKSLVRVRNCGIIWVDQGGSNSLKRVFSINTTDCGNVYLTRRRNPPYGKRWRFYILSQYLATIPYL